MLLDKKISVIYFVKQIKSQIILIVVFAAAIGLLDNLPIFKEIALPLSIPALVGTAVSLLLAFRTAQSYERWWEARTVWGAIVNDSRTFIRQVTQFTSKDNKQIADQFTERQIIWVYALGEALRRQPFSPKVQAYLNFHKISGANIPNALLDKHSHDIALLEQKGIISDFKQVQLNETLARLCDSMGKCERIKNTVFPKSYSLLVHTLIYVFAAILPFGLEDSQLAVEVLMTIMIPLLFISIEKTAIIMQDPFENTPVDTPMTSLAQTIEINLLEMTGAQDIPVKPKNNEYYEM
ncbi:bestrophin family ion channel [Flavobacterium sp.]|uniref:bestrophin family protein n=1 Tax=Flavobacterium sp. TaxID=239 RepID=UPI0031D00F7B